MCLWYIYIYIIILWKYYYNKFDKLRNRIESCKKKKNRKLYIDVWFNIFYKVIIILLNN